MRKLIAAIDRFLAVIENAFIVVVVTIMLLLGFLQVVLKWAEAGLLWGDPFLRHLVLWVGFIGASLATRDEKHIRIDALNRITSPRALPYIKIVIDVVSMAVCVILAHAGYVFLQYELEAETILFNAYGYDFPSWIFQIMIPVGFGMIAVRFLLKAAGRVLDLTEGRQAPAAGAEPS